jgi:opacity protein-like surface antigen
MKSLSVLLLFFLFSFSGVAQTIEELLDDQSAEKTKTEYTSAAFKSVQLINSHTTKLPDKGDLVFLISHRFGPVSAGFSDLWGLDLATIRLGFEYGLTETTSLGIGRSTYKSNFDVFAKQLLLRQSTGAVNMPITLGVIGSANISSDKWPNDGRDYLFAHRLSYSLQLLATRKFNRSISLMLMPTYIHRNLVKNAADQNDVFAIGAGGRFKVSNRVALTAEYHYLLPGQTATDFINPLSVGVDIETGGHVFQLFFTNASSIYDAAYIAETTANWLKGNVRFGFNISRTF